MKKTIQVTGSEGTISAIMEVRFNHRSEIVPVHNRGTHDDELHKVWYHRVFVTMDGQPQMQSKEFTNKADALKIVEELEKSVTDHLQKIANRKPVKSPEDELKERGFQ